MRPLEPGLCSVTFRSMEPQKLIGLAAENGLSAIEWGGDIHVPPGDLVKARAVGAQTADAGLRVSSYGSYLFAPDFEFADVDAVLDAAEALNTRHIRVWAGSRKRPSADYLMNEREVATTALAKISESAAKRGMTIGLEYHPNSLTDNLASSLQLATDLPFDNLFFYWQPAPGLPLEEALKEIAALGSRVCHLHVFAWLADASRLALREHENYWRACIDAMPQSTWQSAAYAMLEFVKGDDIAQFEQDVATLKAILGRS